MRDLIYQKSLGLVRAGILALVFLCVYSCSSKTVEPIENTGPDISGTWVDTIIVESDIRETRTDPILLDTIYLISDLTLDRGSFSLVVPVGIFIGNLQITEFTGTYRTTVDSLFMYFKISSIDTSIPDAPDTNVYIDTEAFSFDYSGDSLALIFNSGIGPFDPNNPNGPVIHIILPSSRLWWGEYFRNRGSFSRVKKTDNVG